MNGKLSPQFLMKRLEGEANKETRKAALLIKNPDVDEKNGLKQQTYGWKRA